MYQTRTMNYDKSYFNQFDETINKEKEVFKAREEVTTLPDKKCDHQGKVTMVKNELRCKCGAAWSGSNIEALYKLLNK